MRGLGYTESQASERINAMRLMLSVEAAKIKIETGALSLSNAAAVQRFFKIEAKVNRKKYSLTEKTELIQEISGKSKREAQKIFLEKSPGLIPQERKRAVSSEETEIRFIAKTALMEKIDRVRELKGELLYSEIFEKAVDAYLREIDPTKSLQDTPPAELKTQTKKTSNSSRYIPVQVKQTVWKRSFGQCEYVDPITHNRCQSRYRLQYDHIKPFCQGGQARSENIRHLCLAHNQSEARVKLGLEKMQKHLSPKVRTG